MFRLFTAACICTVLVSAFARADDSSDDGAESTPMYELTMTEFSMASADAPELSSLAILRAFHDRQNNDEVSVIQTVRLSTLADLECNVQHGLQTAVTTGLINNGRAGQQRVTENMELGTIVRVVMVPHNDKVEVRLSYESSRFDGDGDVDAPPDIVTSTFNTTFVAEQGKATLVGGHSADSAKYLVIFVRS